MLLSFIAIFVGTVVAGGSKYDGKTYVDALKAIDPSKPLGGGFACAIVATIVSFMALVLSLGASLLQACPKVVPRAALSPPLPVAPPLPRPPVADCCEKAAPPADTTDVGLPK